MKSITVFCESSVDNLPVFEEAAIQLGQALAKRDIHLVYGGARVGIMGVIADAVLAAGGKVTGVLPHF